MWKCTSGSWIPSSERWSSRTSSVLMGWSEGKHGWHVEMSQRSAGGRSCGSCSSESRCYECGLSAHRMRDCRSRSSRSSDKRSSSPYSSHRHSSPSRLSHSRSPRWDNRHRDSSPRNGSDLSSSPGMERDHSRSQNFDRSKSLEVQESSSVDGYWLITLV